ncbi:hypothetical protein CSPX01_15710 [Colletotrichum filicis]|nr:hypothetical protein CSPX01_15710 [Colletotrichum filicis]
MKTIPYATLLMALAYFANALPQTPEEGCDSVAICNDVCGKQGMKRGGSSCTGNNSANCVCVPK